MSDKTLKERLARFMDNKAFVAKAVGKVQAEKLKARRSIALERADASIRFFLKEENFKQLSDRRAARETDPHG